MGKGPLRRLSRKPMEPPKETPREALVRLVTSDLVKQLATNKDQMAHVLRAHEGYASHEDTGHPAMSPEYLQEVRRAIRLLDQSPDLTTFLEKVKSDPLPDLQKVKFGSSPPNVVGSMKPMEPYEVRMRKFISSCILVFVALSFIWFYLFLDADSRAVGYGLLAFFAIGGIAIRFEPQIQRWIKALKISS
jgi:hypothetical protein